MTGSLQMKNGRWHMVFSTMKDGKQVQTWKSTRLPIKGNKRKAEDMLKEELRRMEEQAAAKPNGDIAMQELIREWLAVKKREIRSNSYTSYQETAENHVIPYFAKKKSTAATLTTAQIKQYYNAKFSHEGLSPESLCRHRTILRGALDYAIETLDLISVNAADRAKLPKNRAKSLPTYYSPEQIKMLFQAVEGESIEAPVRLAATYGLRRSEALGLMWSAVDLAKKTIRIEYTVVRDGKVVIEDKMVKEEASYRTMPLTKDMETFLKSLQKRQKQHKKLCGSSYHDNDFICKWLDGKPLDPAYVTSRFKRFLKAKGLPHVKFHGLL